MKFFLDSEFIEDGSTIRLISIGIVADDGREYYAEASLDDQTEEDIRNNPWLMVNVVPHLNQDTKIRSQIAAEIAEFVRAGGSGEPEFWGYCAAYDWMVLNQLYGPMIHHPSRWPFYCNDIAQLAIHYGMNRRSLPAQEGVEHNALADARWTRDSYYYIKTRIST